MNTLRAAMLVALAAPAMAFAAPAAADDYHPDLYVAALDKAGLIAHEGSDGCAWIAGICSPQFDDGPDAIGTGAWVCDLVAQGKTRGKIVVFDLGRGEGVGPYANRAPMIFNAATTYLC